MFRLAKIRRGGQLWPLHYTKQTDRQTDGRTDGPKCSVGDVRTSCYAELWQFGRTMLSQSHQSSVSDMSSVVKRQCGQSAEPLVVIQERHQSVVTDTGQTQLKDRQAWKQDRQTLQRLVIDVAQATDTPGHHSEWHQQTTLSATT